MFKTILLTWAISLLLHVKFTETFRIISAEKKTHLTSGKFFDYNHAQQCGYANCPKVKKNSLNVHLVPHSHDDTGWLKTVDQYYYGANNSIQNAGVQYIYDSVVDQLWQDPEKRFVSVEMAFFWRWWRERGRETHDRVRQLVNRGQLEFVGGGWCMNDEATTHYTDIIDQMSFGLKFLNDTFGSCGMPRSVWQIDPFGHSREQASIFSQMGFDSLFLGRIDYQDKERRLKDKEMEMMWKGSTNFGADIFTGVLYNTYSPPPKFCFDILCGDEPIVDNRKSPEYNVDRRAAELVEYIKEQSKHYSTNNILLTMGEDFNYQYAHTWFFNMDKLIKFINKQYAKEGIRLYYSTPSCYWKAVSSSKTSFPSKTDDFFPYASDPHAYWTGFFSSRPAIKRFVRAGSNFLQSCKQLHAAQKPGKLPNKDLRVMERAMAVSQHHDAVSGTEKQHVASDYAARISQGITACENTISQGYSMFLSNDFSLPDQVFCHLLNVSQCWVTENSPQFVLTVYNPLGWNASSYVKVPVLDDSFTVFDSEGKSISYQVIDLPKAVLKIPGRTSKAQKELVFHAEDIPPLGIKSYHVTRGKRGGKHSSKTTFYNLPRTEDFRVTKNRKTLKFSGKSGLLMSFGNGKETYPVNQEFMWYQSMAGNNTKYEFRASGAYIFRPNGTATPLKRISAVEIVEGSLVTEVRQVYSSWLTQIFRLYHAEEFVEMDWVVGPIPVQDGVGKEIISRFSSSQFDNAGVFYTDSNGRQMVERRRNERPTFKLNVTEPVAGNYYPVNSFIAIRGQEEKPLQMTVLVDRAQGGSSIVDGSLELMVHRRMLYDDAFGVGEALNETAYGQGLVVRGTHWLLMDRDADWRSMAQRKYKNFINSFVPTNLSVEEWKSQFSMKFSLVKESLPPNVNLLTVEPWGKFRILIRLEHIYENGEHPTLSRDVNVNLKDLFSTFQILAIEEVNLASTQSLKTSVNIDEISLGPMQIRSFLVTVKPNNIH